MQREHQQPGCHQLELRNPNTGGEKLRCLEAKGGSRCPPASISEIWSILGKLLYPPQYPSHTAQKAETGQPCFSSGGAHSLIGVFSKRVIIHYVLSLRLKKNDFSMPLRGKNRDKHNSLVILRKKRRDKHNYKRAQGRQTFLIYCAMKQR